MIHWLRDRIPGQEALLSNRWIQPFAHRLADPVLWHFNRRSIARGVALGLFLGFLIPLGQTPAAAMLALTVRANVAVAAVATLVTNPLTFPAIYFAAYKVGQSILKTQHANRLSDRHVVEAWTFQFGEWLVSLTLPIMLGLLIFGSLASVTGYWGVHLGWRLWISQRWRHRRYHKPPTGYRD